MKMKRNRGFLLALSALILTGFEANAAEPAASCPAKDAFTQEAAQQLFEYRTDPKFRVGNPECNHRARFTVIDEDGTKYIDHSFFVGANPGDASWKYAEYIKIENTVDRPDNVSLAALDELFRLAEGIKLPMSESYSPATLEASLSKVVADYTAIAPDAVGVLEAYFAKPSASEAALATAQASMNTLLALSGVNITCDTLSSRLKYKSPACDGATGVFDVIGCQFNYDATQVVRKRGITRVVFYRAGHRGDPAHALESRTYLCSDNADRAELQSWFATPAFRQICRREDYDIPYQTQAGSCY